MSIDQRYTPPKVNALCSAIEGGTIRLSGMAHNEMRSDNWM